MTDAWELACPSVQRLYGCSSKPCCYGGQIKYACMRNCMAVCSFLTAMRLGRRRDIGATVLIDDNPRYALECAAAGH